jgi:hypothetical protein
MTLDLSHLTAPTREQAFHDAKTRIRLVQTARWVGFPRAGIAVEELERRSHYPSCAVCHACCCTVPVAWARDRPTPFATRLAPWTWSPVGKIRVKSAHSVRKGRKDRFFDASRCQTRRFDE